MDATSWQPLLDQVVVIDTNSQFVYIGTLAKVEDHFVVLKEVDVHDRNEGQATKERYVMDTKKFGVKANRKEVSVRKTIVVSVSKLDDIILF